MRPLVFYTLPHACQPGGFGHSRTPDHHSPSAACWISRSDTVFFYRGCFPVSSLQKFQTLHIQKLGRANLRINLIRIMTILLRPGKVTVPIISTALGEALSTHLSDQEDKAVIPLHLPCLFFFYNLLYCYFYCIVFLSKGKPRSSP